MRAQAIVGREFAFLEGSIHRARLECFAAVVAGVLAASRLSLTRVGRALRGRARPKHEIKRVDRLLGNAHLHAEVPLFYRRFAQLAAAHPRPVLLIDWTDIGTLWAALVVTLVVEGRGVVLCAEVHPRRKENHPRVESSVLKKVAQLLPHARPILVTDAGFRGPWLRKVLDMGWDFVSRVRGRVQVQRRGCPGWVPVKTLWAQAQARPRILGDYQLARYLPVEARLVAVWKKRARKKLPRVGRRVQRSIRSAREPWMLATSLRALSAREVVALYATRMRIEETFRDQKCLRFGLGLDDVRTRDKKRVEVYLLLAAVAHYVASLIGAAAERAGLHRQFQANTVRTRRVLSWARLGRELLAHALRSTPVMSLAQVPSVLATLGLPAEIRGDP